MEKQLRDEIPLGVAASNVMHIPPQGQQPCSSLLRLSLLVCPKSLAYPSTHLMGNLAVVILRARMGGMIVLNGIHQLLIGIGPASPKRCHSHMDIVERLLWVGIH